MCQKKPFESSEKVPLSGCYEVLGVPHLDEANGPKGVIFSCLTPREIVKPLSHGGDL